MSFMKRTRPGNTDDHMMGHTWARKDRHTTPKVGRSQDFGATLAAPLQKELRRWRRSQGLHEVVTHSETKRSRASGLSLHLMKLCLQRDTNHFCLQQPALQSLLHKTAGDGQSQGQLSPHMSYTHNVERDPPGHVGIVAQGAKDL